MIVTLQEPDAAVFAPFGAFLAPPADVGGRAMFSQWLEPVPGRAQQCHVNRVAVSTLPATVDRVERHPHAAQIFVPIGVSRYLVTVMPPDETGAPDSGRTLAFVVPGTVGVAYHPGTWHAGISVLDVEASFAVMMWRGGEEDDVFASISPITLQPDSSAAITPRRESSAAITPHRESSAADTAHRESSAADTPHTESFVASERDHG